MMRELFVGKSVIAIEQLKDTAILPSDISEREFSLRLHSAAQFAVQLDLGFFEESWSFELSGALVAIGPRLPIGEASSKLLELPLELLFLTRIPGQDHTFINGNAFHIANLQPLPGKIANDPIGAFVCKHALHLGRELLPQFVPTCQSE